MLAARVLRAVGWMAGVIAEEGLELWDRIRGIDPDAEWQQTLAGLRRDLYE